MTKAINNFKLVTNGMTGAQISAMIVALKVLTGYEYGYMPHEMADTTILSFTATLCKKKRVLLKHALAVKLAAMAWLNGAGIACYRFEWISV